VTADAVLAIDQGTSATKAVVVSPVEGVIASAEIALHPQYLAGGGVEQEPLALLDSVLDAGRRALARARSRVGVVAIANQGETVLAWDPESGRPLSPAIVWQDRRASGVCAELDAHREMVAARTGLVLDPYFSAPKMIWLRRNLTSEGVVTTTDSWLIHRLTGEFVTDVSTASRSLVMNIDRVEWDEQLLELFALNDERLPRIVASDECVGTTTAFGEAITVGGLVVDQQAALLAQRCWAQGEAKCTFGTGAFLLANTGPRAVRSVAGLTSSVAWRIDGSTVYCIDGQIYAAGSAVRWLIEMGFISHARDLDALATDDAAGVLCMPALAGLAAPWWRPDATATFAGVTLATRPEHIVTAVLQGIAAQVAELADVIAQDTGQPLRSLRVDGGLIQSRVLMQAVADLTQLPIGLYPSAHATALGAAALGRLSIEPGLTLEQAVPDQHPRTTLQPRWSPENAREFRERWRRITASTLSQKDDG
jgi:glycerol kinase